MQITALAIADVKAITPTRHDDDRGFVAGTYSARAMEEAGLTATFVQDNHSHSRAAGTLRGLHFQRPPHAQVKLVRVVRGAAFCVALDLRTGAPSHGDHVAVTLAEEAPLTQFYVPIGFAHGVMTLRPDTVMLYKLSQPYDAASAGGVLWNDPLLNISWPQPAEMITLSPADRTRPRLSALPEIFRYAGPRKEGP